MREQFLATFLAGIKLKDNIGSLLLWASKIFKDNNIDSPFNTAQIFLCHILDVDKTYLYLNDDKIITSSQKDNFLKLVERRLKKEPVAYILSKKSFWKNEFFVDKNVLIPRPETEIIIEFAQNVLTSSQFILELGVGSGALIVSLAHDFPNNFYFASDISFEAICIAKKNAKNHNRKNSIYFFLSDFFSSIKIKESFDLIVSNPPYIPTNEICNLEHEVSLFEPKLALDGGFDGLSYLKKIIVDAHMYLKKKGHLLLEIGDGQSKMLFDFVKEEKNYENIFFLEDYSKKKRVLHCQKKS